MLDPSGSRDPASSRRRPLLGAAGLALLGGLAGCEAPDGEAGDGGTPKVDLPGRAGRTLETDPNLNLGGRRVVSHPAAVGYDTVEDAFDAAESGDTIHVHGSYDAEAGGERFPIRLDYTEKQVALVGGHRSGSVIDASHVDENAVEVVGRGFNDYRNNPYLGNLKVVGGSIGLRIRGAPYSLYERLTFHETGSHAVAVEGYTDAEGNDKGTFGSTFWNCLAWSCGGSGFHLGDEARAHGTTFDSCAAVWNGIRNEAAPPGVRLRGFNSRWVNGTVQGNGGVGVDARGGASQMVGNTYLEGNGLADSNPRGIALGSAGGAVAGCYFYGAYARGTGPNGLDRARLAVDLGAADRAQVRNCTYRRYSNAFLRVRDAADVDVHVPSHAALDGTDFLVRDGAHRLRSDGVVLPTDLRNVDGTFVGDVGVHDGSGRGSFAPAVWTGSEWATSAVGRRL